MYWFKYYHRPFIDYFLFQDIKKELNEASIEFKNNGKMAWIPPEGWLNAKAPKCHAWLQSSTRYPIKFTRFHMTPPKGRLNIHVDGTLENPRRYALNIPVAYTEDAPMKWYDFSDKRNWKNDYVEPRDKLYDAKGGVPVDESKCEVVDETCIDWPTFVRTDIPHSIDNPHYDTRIILSIRFDCDYVIELKDLIPSRLQVPA